MVQSKGGFILRCDDTEQLESHVVLSNNTKNESPEKQQQVQQELMGIRPLFDEDSHTCTYLLWDKETEDAILVDPVVSQVKRDLLVTTELKLRFVVNTHLHEDHVVGNASIKRRVPSCKSVLSQAAATSCNGSAGDAKAVADEYVNHGDQIRFGNRYVTVLATPGHSSGCMSLLLDDGKAVLTGDALWIGGQTGRCDLPDSSAEVLYDSIQRQLFTLSDDCRVFPGHDYNMDQISSTIGQEKTCFANIMSKEEFVSQTLRQKQPHLPETKDIALPANRRDGAKPFFVRTLRTRIKERWGIFG
jgi:sulfur dioxygenase